MNKEEILKQLFLLSQEDILDVCEILSGYRGSIKKMKNDTFALRSVYIAGYHSTGEFYKKHNLTKDTAIGQLLSGKAFNVKTYCELKNILNIDDDLFLKIILENNK